MDSRSTNIVNNIVCMALMQLELEYHCNVKVIYDLFN